MNDDVWRSQSKHHHIITQDDPQYPYRLKTIDDPPDLLYVVGDPTILQQPQIAIVGSRQPTPTGIEIARHFAHMLSLHGWIVTSGLAKGIDTAAHQGALHANKPTIAVMGTGPNIIYPRQNHHLAHQIKNNRGALITEFAPGLRPIAHHFPRRNRIISSLSYGTLVVEATQKSGSLITARLANEQGRDVFAVPGSIYNQQSSGCHALIKQGAKLVEHVNDILEELNVMVEQDPKVPMPDTHQPLASFDHNLIQCIASETVDVDTLVNRCHGVLSDVVSRLAQLETQGYVTRCISGYQLTAKGIHALRSTK